MMPSKLQQGQLVAFCGIDGCGKTTQLRELSAWLRREGAQVVETRQPTSFYRDQPVVRAYLDDGDNRLGMTGLSLLAAADRQLHVRTVVDPALQEGSWVLTDRYVYSTYAFFGARGVDDEYLRLINKDVPKPFLTVLLTVDPEVARQRVAARDGSTLKFEERSLAFMQDVQERFIAAADGSFLTLDGSRASGELASEIQAEVLARLGESESQRAV